MSASAPRSPLAAAIASWLSESTSRTLRPSVRGAESLDLLDILFITTHSGGDDCEQRTDHGGNEDENERGQATRLLLGGRVRRGIVGVAFAHATDHAVGAVAVVCRRDVVVRAAAVAGGVRAGLDVVV